MTRRPLSLHARNPRSLTKALSESQLALWLCIRNPTFNVAISDWHYCFVVQIICGPEVPDSEVGLVVVTNAEDSIFLGQFDPEDEGTTIHRKLGKHLPTDTT